MKGTLAWFNERFSRRLIALSGDPVADATRALSTTYPILKKDGTPSASRLASGWGVVTDDAATLQLRLVGKDVEVGEATRYEAWLDVLEAFSGPALLLAFAKKPVPVKHLVRTHDLRRVAICSAAGVEVFDWTAGEASAPTHRILRNLAEKRARAA